MIERGKASNYYILFLKMWDIVYTKKSVLNEHINYTAEFVHLLILLIPELQLCLWLIFQC